MDSLVNYLDMLEDILDNSKSVPFTNRISVEKEKIFDVISEIRMNLPNEMRQAQRIIEDHDKIIADAKTKASSMLKEAQARSQEMTDDHEIYKMAVEQARELMEDAKKSARDMRLNALDYADEILEKTEKTVKLSINEITQNIRELENDFNGTVNMIYTNRQELRGIKE